MPTAAIIYATTEHQTEKIAKTLARHLHEHGISSRILNVDEVDTDLPLIGCSGVLIGASVHQGSHQSSITQFVKKHHTTLAMKPSAFFSVSLSAAGELAEQQDDATRIMKNFEQETSWTPNCDVTFAGALKYREYGIVKRTLMRMISKRAGGDTDTSSNHEYTNWNDVALFAQKFANIVIAGEKSKYVDSPQI